LRETGGAAGTQLNGAPMNLLKQGGRALLLALLLLVGVRPAAAQTEPRLRLIDLNTASFPRVGVVVLTLDGRSAPVLDLSSLALRENGVPLSDYTLTHVPVGIDVAFVLDANQGFNLVDDEADGRSRLEKVRASIGRFATEYMHAAGLDRVSIVAPDAAGENGRFLVQQAMRPADLLNAMEDYQPERFGPTPLNAMLNQALDAFPPAAENGRYRALLLFTDGGRLDQQLAFLPLVAKANDANVPIYVVILGARADDFELANAARLYEPTRGWTLHAPRPEDADPIYRLWQQQGNPPLIQYRSLQRQSGGVTVTVNLGPAQVAAAFEVTLAPPDVTLRPERETIRRVGSAPDTPLPALQPAVQPLTVAVAWPDGRPRRLQTLTLLENGRAQPALENVVLDAANQLVLPWDVSGLDGGPVTLQVQVTDELGFTAVSAPLALTIVVERPSPPTPTPAPETAAPTTVGFLPLTPLQAGLGATALAILLLSALLAGWQQRRARRKAPSREEPGAAAVETAPAEAASAPDDWPETAVLRPQAPTGAPSILLDAPSVTVGRDPAAANVVLSDPSVARLHARIRRSGGRFWLYDEGSAEGTFLNFERLGLAPRPLADGDTLQFGRVIYTFHRGPVGDSPEAPRPES